MGYCPECGFSIMPDSLTCSHCGNREFHMTIRVFWDNCDRCRPDAGLNNSKGDASCLACSGEGVREYRVMKDARSGLLYYERFDSVLQRFHE